MHDELLKYTMLIYGIVTLKIGVDKIVFVKNKEYNGNAAGYLNNVKYNWKNIIMKIKRRANNTYNIT